MYKRMPGTGYVRGGGGGGGGGGISVDGGPTHNEATDIRLIVFISSSQSSIRTSFRTRYSGYVLGLYLHIVTS